jgi:3-oxoacyl-[acyl-carrier protein] reductase
MKNKIALIIGGSRGIGRAIALKLAESGLDMWITYNSNSEAAEEVKQKIEALGRKCETLCFDVSNYEQTKEILSKKLKEDTPEVVVYNSGIAKDNLLAFMGKDEWDSVIRVNLDGFYNVMNPVIFEMLAKKRGRIIVIASTSGEIGQAGQVNYSASKAGLIGAAKALAREVGRKKILVNVVSPGVIETEMTADLPKDMILPLIPLKRYGKPEEVASVVNFLATEENMYIHGQVISVNGGLSM